MALDAAGGGETSSTPRCRAWHVPAGGWLTAPSAPSTRQPARERGARALTRRVRAAVCCPTHPTSKPAGHIFPRQRPAPSRAPGTRTKQGWGLGFEQGSEMQRPAFCKRRRILRVAAGPAWDPGLQGRRGTAEKVTSRYAVTPPPWLF